MNGSKFARLMVPVAWAMLIGAGLACAGLAGQPAARTLPPTQTGANGANGDDPTQGAIVRATRQAQATQLVLASTATAQFAAAQATQDAHATSVAQATAQSLLAAKSEWPRVLAETFKNNDLAWPVGVTQDHSLSVTSAVKDGRYSWSVVVTNGNSYFNLVPQKGPVLGDFYATLDVTLADGNQDNGLAYGLVFRQVKDDYGFFGIQQDGSFRVLEVHHTGIYTELIESSPLIDTHPGQVNHLGVVGVGSDFVFLVDDQVVAQMNADLSPGQIGLGVDTTAQAPEAGVDFSNFMIYAPKP